MTACQEKAVSMNRGDGFDSGDQAKGGKGRKNLQMGVAAKKSHGDEVVAGAARGIAQDKLVKRRERREGWPQAREGSGARGFGYAKERSTETESVSKGSDEHDGCEGQYRGAADGGGNSVVSADPNGSGDAENREGW